MAILSLGYPGTVDAKAQATWLPMVAAAPYSVAGTGDLRVSQRTGADRGISVAAGTAAGDGVMDTLDVADNTLAIPIQSSGSRWYLVALRRNWSTNKTTLVLIGGSASKELPKRETTPGTLSDQPLALVRVEAGQAAVREIIDLRVWGGPGGMFALDELVMAYMTKIGVSIQIGAYRWTRTLNSSLAPGWSKSVQGGAISYIHHDWVNNRLTPVSTSPDGNDIVLARYTIPDPGFPYYVGVRFACEAGNVAPTRWDLNIKSNKGGLVAKLRGDVVRPFYHVYGHTLTPATGASIIDVSIQRLAGTSNFGLGAVNRELNYLVTPALS